MYIYAHRHVIFEYMNIRKCIYVYIYIYVCVCAHFCYRESLSTFLCHFDIHVQTHKHVHTCTHIYTYTYIYRYMDISMYLLHTSVQTNISFCIHRCMYMYTRMLYVYQTICICRCNSYIYIYACICIHISLPMRINKYQDDVCRSIHISIYIYVTAYVHTKVGMYVCIIR